MAYKSALIKPQPELKIERYKGTWQNEWFGRMATSGVHMRVDSSPWGQFQNSSGMGDRSLLASLEAIGLQDQGLRVLPAYTVLLSYLCFGLHGREKNGVCRYGHSKALGPITPR